MNNQSKRSVIQTALINFGLGCALEILPEGCTVDQEETLIWLIHIVSINRSILTTDDIEKMVRLIVDKGHTKIQIRTNHPDLDYHNKTLEWLNRIVLANSAILTPRDIENMVLLAETGRTKEQIRSNYPGLNYNQKTLTWLEGIILENRSILTQYDIENIVALVELGGTEALIRTNYPTLNYNSEKTEPCQRQKRPVESSQTRKDNQTILIDVGFSYSQAVKLSTMSKKTIPAALVENLPQLFLVGFNTSELFEIAKNKLISSCFETLIDHYPQLLRFGFIHSDIVDIFSFQNAVSISRFIIKTLAASTKKTADKCNFVDILTRLRHNKRITADLFKAFWVPTEQTISVVPQMTYNHSLLFWIPEPEQASSTTSGSYTP